MPDKIVDARGRSCPEPVVMTKKALEYFMGELKVLVDSEVAKENIQRFVTKEGYRVQIMDLGDEYELTISK